VTLAEAASRLAVSRMTVIRLIKGRLLPAKQACIGAPYVIRETDLDLSIVRHAIEMDVQYQWIRDRELWNINNVGR